MPTFKKIERLCGKTAITTLFEKGKGKTVQPLKLMYLPAEFMSDFPARCMFVVPKKKFKRANKRNALKRRMREAYRLHKEDLYKALGDRKLDLAFIYLSHEPADYASIEASIKHLLTFLVQQNSTNGQIKPL